MKKEFLIGAAMAPFLGGLTVGRVLIDISHGVDSPVWGKRLYNAGNTITNTSVDGLDWVGRQLEKAGVLDIPEAKVSAVGFRKISRAFVAGVVTSGAVCLGGVGLAGYGIVEGVRYAFNEAAPHHRVPRHRASLDNTVNPVVAQGYTPYV